MNRKTKSKLNQNLLGSNLSFVFSLSDGQKKEIIVSKSDTKVLITDYNSAKDYIVSVIAVSGTEQSRPLQGRHKGAFMHFTVFASTPLLFLHVALILGVLYSSTLFFLVLVFKTWLFSFICFFLLVLFFSLLSVYFFFTLIFLGFSRFLSFPLLPLSSSYQCRSAIFTCPLT